MNKMIVTKLKYYLFPKALIAVGLFVAVGCYNFISNFAYDPEYHKIGFLNAFLFSTLFGQNVFHYLGSFIAIFPASRLLFEELSTHIAQHRILQLGCKSKYCSHTLLKTCFITTAVILTGCCMVFLICICISPKSSYPLFFVWKELAFSSLYWNSMVSYTVIHIFNLIFFSISCTLLSSGIFLITRNRLLGYALIPVGYWFSSYLKGIRIGSMSLLPSGTISLIMIHSPLYLFACHAAGIVVGILLCRIGLARWINK